MTYAVREVIAVIGIYAEQIVAVVLSLLGIR